MTYPFESHPDDETIERYALRALPEPEAAILEEHLLRCERCRRVLESTDAYIRAFQGAAEGLMQPVRWRHLTEDGPVLLTVVPTASGSWRAEFRGKSLEGGREFKALRQANKYVLKAFADLFPGHKCGGDCGAMEDADE